jgi:hypothetical protein
MNNKRKMKKKKEKFLAYQAKGQLRLGRVRMEVGRTKVR